MIDTYDEPFPLLPDVDGGPGGLDALCEALGVRRELWVMPPVGRCSAHACLELDITGPHLAVTEPVPDPECPLGAPGPPGTMTNNGDGRVWWALPSLSAERAAALLEQASADADMVCDHALDGGGRLYLVGEGEAAAFRIAELCRTAA